MNLKSLGYLGASYISWSNIMNFDAQENFSWGSPTHFDCQYGRMNILAVPVIVLLAWLTTTKVGMYYCIPWLSVNWTVKFRPMFYKINAHIFAGLFLSSAAVQQRKKERYVLVQISISERPAQIGRGTASVEPL